MISVGFKSEYNKEEISKLSVISEADSFIYGFFDSENTLLESGRKNKNEIEGFLQLYNNYNTFILSKSNSFTHIHSSKLKEVKNLLPFQDQMNGEEIYTLFDDEWFSTSNNPNSIKHISTAIQTRFRFAEHPICYIHFNKSSIIICICGSTGFKFFNEFEIENAEDIIYFTKSVLQTLNVDEEKVVLKLSGYIEEGYIFYKMLQRYFYNIEFTTAYNFKVKDNISKEHYYFDHYLNIAF